MSKRNQELSLWPYLRHRQREPDRKAVELIPVERYDQERESHAISRHRKREELLRRNLSPSLNLRRLSYE